MHTQTLLDEQVTADAISKIRAFFAAAKPEDTLVALVAGHGTRANDAAAKYYFVTHDTDVKHVAETAAPFETIEGLFDGVAARKKLLLLDTCESGERDDDAMGSAQASGARGIRSRALAFSEDRPAPVVTGSARAVFLDRERFIYRDLSRRTGAVVLASSRGSESSYELDELKNGTFTAALKTALSTPRADADKDGAVSIDELRRFVADDVAKNTGGKQHPTLDRDNPAALIGFAAGANVEAAPTSAPATDASGNAGGAVKPSARHDEATSPETVHPPQGCGCRVVAEKTSNAPSVLGVVAGLACLTWRRKRRARDL